MGLGEIKVNAAKPIAGKNALESVAFVIQFGSEFNQQDVEALASLKDRFSSELPSFEKITTFVFSAIGLTAPQQTTQRDTGVLLQHFQENGRADWLLRVAANQIVVQCNAYTDWSEVWSKASRYLKAAALSVKADSKIVLGVAAQFVNKFVYATVPSDYSIEGVFNVNSPYLTKQACESGVEWHVFQGWFVDSASKGFARGGRLLNGLNLSSVIQGDKALHAIIDHTAQFNFAAEAQPQLFSDSSALDAYFTFFHKENIYIIARTLAENQLTAIGISK